MKLRRAEVPRREIIGLRNLLAHGYWKIDAEEPWDVTRNELPHLLAAIRSVFDGGG